MERIEFRQLICEANVTSPPVLQFRTYDSKLIRLAQGKEDGWSDWQTVKSVPVTVEEYFESFKQTS